MVPDNQEPQEEWRHQDRLPEDFDHIAPSYSLLTGMEDSIYEVHPSDDGPILKNFPTPRVHTFLGNIHFPSPWDDDVTSENDDEPDEVFFQPDPNERGIKVEDITKLKQDGGFHNYRNWRIELGNAFDADPARYTTAVKRIAFAIKHFDNDMKESWRMQAQCHPHLRRHWRKFLRWIEKDHLHGDPNRYKYLQEFYGTTQDYTEEPMDFYIRLNEIATILERNITMDDYFPRLQEHFQDALIQDQPIGELDGDWLYYAQGVWNTLKLILKSTKRKRTDQHDDESSLRPSKRVSIGGRVAEERNQRRANNLCLRCGRGGHFAAACTSQPQEGSVNPLDSGPMRPPQVQPTRPQHALRQNFSEYKRAHVQPVETVNDQQPSDDSDSDYRTDSEKNQESKTKKESNVYPSARL